MVSPTGSFYFFYCKPEQMNLCIHKPQDFSTNKFINSTKVWSQAPKSCFCKFTMVERNYCISKKLWRLITREPLLEDGVDQREISGDIIYLLKSDFSGQEFSRILTWKNNNPQQDLNKLLSVTNNGLLCMTSSGSLLLGC